MRDLFRAVSRSFKFGQGIFKKIGVVGFECYASAFGEQGLEKRKERPAGQASFCIALFRPRIAEVYVNSFKASRREDLVES